MLKGIKIRKDKPVQLEEPPVQKKTKQNADDEVLLSQIHRQRIKEKGLDFQDIGYDEEDIGTQPKSSRERKQAENKQNQVKGQQMYEQRKHAKVLGSCNYCLSNEKIGGSFILSNGGHTLLLLPQQTIFKDYWHFQLLPIDHVSSICQADTEAYDEIRNYMKCLVAAFDKLDMEMVFYENAYNFKNLPHAIVDCVAIPNSKLKEGKLNLYFKQGMDDLDGYWSTHKKIIEINKGNGGLRKQIPKEFPYFYVDFSLQFGYGHVIENEIMFGPNFAREILASVLGIDKNFVLCPTEKSEEDARQLQENFNKIWQKFDWTMMLKQ